MWIVNAKLAHPNWFKFFSSVHFCSQSIWPLTFLWSLTATLTITNVEVRARTGQQTMDNILRERLLRWLGHVFRMDHQHIPQQALYWQVPGYKRGPGQPRVNLRGVISKDLHYKRWGSPGRKQRWQLLTDTDGVGVWPNVSSWCGMNQGQGPFFTVHIVRVMTCCESVFSHHRIKTPWMHHAMSTLNHNSSERWVWNSAINERYVSTAFNTLDMCLMCTIPAKQLL